MRGRIGVSRQVVVQGWGGEGGNRGFCFSSDGCGLGEVWKVLGRVAVSGCDFREEDFLEGAKQGTRS